MSIAGYIVATRNPASGRLTLDWDGELHDEYADAKVEVESAKARGFRAVLLRAEVEDD